MSELPRTGEDHTRSPYEPELGSTESMAGEDESVNKTGTTTVGIATDDAVVIATDMRASLGGRFVSNKDVQKVEQIHPTAALTLVGSVGGAQSFIRSLRAEASLYETRRGKPMDIPALSTLAGNLARGGPFRAIRPILGGVDSDGSHVYSIDPAGGVMADDYTVTGSGMQLAYGVLENDYAPDISTEEAHSLSARAVEAAVERDTGSGNGVFLATITDDGVDIQGHKDFETVR
jgi:proteasome beta subunit